jgi:hypothetical protein
MKTNLRLGWGEVNWIEMVKDRIQMQAFTFVVMNIQILLQEEIS